ncbi:MAG: YgiQ family radical SAM protein, partial [Desulfobacterales bacterium]|nr:YgiQ family radical SAM protein [Desulfobacterales bacterium]
VDFTPYLISSHPGCTLKEMRNLAQTILKNGLKARQYQDFTPTPGTLSTAMYVTGLDRDTLTPIHVPKGASERRRQRQELEKVSGRYPAESRSNRHKSGSLKGKSREKKRSGVRK